MHAYSQDLRDRVIRALDRGDKPTDIAHRFEVSRVWVYQVQNRLKNEGIRESLPMGGHRKSRIAHMEGPIRSWLQDKPDLTLAELCELLSQKGISIKIPALWHQLDKWGLSFKKNLTRQRARERRRQKKHGLIGSRTSQTLKLKSWCSLMKHG